MVRAPDPGDRRSSLVSVTADGRALLRKARNRKTAYLAHRMRHLPAEDLAALERAADVLERMLEDGLALSPALRRPFLSLAVPNYRRYFTGQVISLSGNWMQIVAEVWLILQLTGSGVAVGLLTAAQFAPILFFGAWGGLLADRIPKRRLLMITQAAMAVPAVVLLLALALTGLVEAWMVVALAFVRGSVNAIDNPARQSFVIEMVGAERVVNAVSLNSVVVHCARMAGPARGRRPDRHRGSGALLRAERAHLRGDARGARADGPRAAGRAPPGTARAGSAARRPALRGADAGARRCRWR